MKHFRLTAMRPSPEELIDFERKFQKISFHDNLHLCSTGALAVEAALKCGFEYTKKPNSIVIGLKNSFHGINSWGFITDSSIASVNPRVKYFPKNQYKKLI